MTSATQEAGARGADFEPERTLGGAPLAERGELFREFLRGVRPAIDRELTRVLDAAEPSTRRLGLPVAVMLETLRSITLAGGKRLRPGLLLAAFRSTAPDAALEPALRAGAALELFQSYLLIHDDWMDGDTLRRGVPTAHTRLREHYGSTRRGDASAILAGDYASALAYRTLLHCGASPERTLRCAQLLTSIEQEVILGQQLDVASDGTHPEIVYELKTASYTVRAPLLMGCILAGFSEEQLAAMDDFARPVGVAFQLRDDLVALLGDPITTGKSLGGDLRAGKLTYCMCQAEGLASRDERAALARVFGRADASDAEVAEAIAILGRCGAIRATERRIEVLLEAAFGALPSSGVAPSHSRLFTSAAFALAYREA